MKQKIFSARYVSFSRIFYFRTILLGVVHALALLLIQSESYGQPAADTTAGYSLPQSLRVPDSTAVSTHDTMLVSDTLTERFLRGMGEVFGERDSLLTREHILWSDSKVPDEMLWRLPGFFVRSLGEVGAPAQRWAYGVSDSRIAVLLDGCFLNDPVTETYALEMLPLEYISDVEVGVGKISPAAASDVTLNFISRTYATIRPRTKIRYVQGVNNTLLTDAFFTQNIFRGANLSFALHRQTSDGTYFNSALDVWNGRAKVRYNLSQHINIALSWLYHQSWRGVNYGVEFPQEESIFDPVQAAVLDENAFEKLYRHDILLNVLAQPLADTSFRTSLTASHTNVEREFRNPPSLIRDPNIRLWTNASRKSIALQQRVALSAFSGVLGIQSSLVTTDSTSVLPQLSETSNSYFGTVAASLFPPIQPSLSYRREYRRNRTLESMAGEINVFPLMWLTLTVQQSWYDRLPTLQEQYWNDSSLVRPYALETEHHALSLAKIKIHYSGWGEFSLTTFQRTVDNALAYRLTQTSGGRQAVMLTSLHKTKVKGIAGNLSLQWKNVECTASIQSSSFREDDTLRTYIPEVVGMGEIAYRDLFFREALEARLGLRVAFYSREYGMRYEPSASLFSDSRSFLLGKATVLDVFGIFRIGDAHVSLTWSNITNVQYIITSMYPMPQSQLTLGVHWEFLD